MLWCIAQNPHSEQASWEVAFAIATCNAILGINDRRNDWLLKSQNDFAAFGGATIQVVSPEKKTALNAGSAVGAVPAIPAMLILMFSGVGTGAGLVLFYGTVATAVGVGMKSSAELGKIKAAEDQLLLDQNEAKDAALEVEAIIAQLTQAE